MLLNIHFKQILRAQMYNYPFSLDSTVQNRKEAGRMGEKRRLNEARWLVVCNFGVFQRALVS